METRTLRVPRKQYREFDIVGRGDVIVATDGDGNEVRKYPLTFSSAEPLPRWSWDGKYLESLSHDPEDVDLSVARHGLPLLKSHQRLLHQGSVEDVVLMSAEAQLGGNARFSSIQIGQEGETMVREGHTKRVSVGYEVLGAELVSTDENGLETWRMKWRPLEVSTEPIPLDQGVGFGRADNGAGQPLRERAAVDDVDMVEFNATVEERAAEPLTEGEGDMAQERKRQDAAPEAPEIRGVEGPGEGGQPRDRGKEAAEIIELASLHGMADRAADWIREERSVEQVQKFILDHIRTKGVAQPASEDLELPERDLTRYSYLRAIRIAANMDKPDGLEGELHQELLRQGGEASHNGVLVPLRLRSREQVSDYALRTMGTGEAAGGATTVGTQRMPDMIDLLRNKSRCLEFGARLFTGLKGNVLFNKKTAAPTVYWMSENPPADVTASEPSHGYVTMSPKTQIGSVQLPKQLLVQADFDHEADVRNDLITGTSQALDLGGLHGTGTDNQPVGIYSAPDVQAHAVGGVPDVTDIQTMIGLNADQNADFGALGWMATPLLASKLSVTPIVSGYPKFLWDGKISDGTMGGYRAGATNQVSKTLGAGSDEHGLIFGNWNELMFGLWGNEMEIIVDVVTLAKRGQVVITSFAMADAALRRPASFVKGTGAKIA